MTIGGGDSGSVDPSHLPGTLIVFLGMLLIIAHVPPLNHVGRSTALVLTVILPSLLGLVLIGVGYWTIKGEMVEAADAWRLTTWIIAGMIVFLLVGGWIVVLEVLLGEPVPHGYLLTVNAVTLGSVVGAVIGLYDAQGRVYTRELERREQHLEEKNEHLDQFASVVSHDLRNPLNVAQGRLELAKEECDSTHFEDIERAHERMAVLIDDLLELARQNKSEANTEPVDFPDIVESAWGNVATEDVELCTEARFTVDADRNRLQQLLENLFRNAIDHGGECVTVGETADHTGFYVEDNGPGIPEDKRDQVFELGYSSRENGTGFGLAIVDAVVNAHNWDINITEGQQSGVRFEITNIDTER